MTRRLHHARQAAGDRRWHWAWRRLHVLMRCKRVTRNGAVSPYGTTEEWSVDAGYCLDRYYLETKSD